MTSFNLMVQVGNAMALLLWVISKIDNDINNNYHLLMKGFVLLMKMLRFLEFYHQLALGT